MPFLFCLIMPISLVLVVLRFNICSPVSLTSPITMETIKKLGCYRRCWVISLFSPFVFCHCSLTCRWLNSLVKCGTSTKLSPPCRKCPCRCQSNSLSSCPPKTQWNSLNTPWACSPLSPVWTRRWSFRRSKCKISIGSLLTTWEERAEAEWWIEWANVSLESSALTRRTCPEALHTKLAFFVFSV